jgi:TatA/E family protein of Tat protein translocase
MGLVNPLHIAFVAVVALLVLGPKRFPEVARSVGKGYREFREQLSAVTSQAHTDLISPAPGTSTVAQATVVEQVSPDREVMLATPPDASPTVPPPAAASGPKSALSPDVPAGPDGV